MNFDSVRHVTGEVGRLTFVYFPSTTVATLESGNLRLKGVAFKHPKDHYNKAAGRYWAFRKLMRFNGMGREAKRGMWQEFFARYPTSRRYRMGS